MLLAALAAAHTRRAKGCRGREKKREREKGREKGGEREKKRERTAFRDPPCSARFKALANDNVRVEKKREDAEGGNARPKPSLRGW